MQKDDASPVPDVARGVHQEGLEDAMDLVVSRLSKPLITARPDTPLGRCARMLVEHKVRHLPVVDEEQRPISMIEDMDVFALGTLLGPEDDIWLAFEPDSDRLQAMHIGRPLGARVLVGSSTLDALVELAAASDSAIGVVDVDGLLVGLFTEHDAAVVARDVVDMTRKVCDFATTPAASVDWMFLAHEALSRMLDEHIRHLVVTRDGKLEGVVSARDLRIAADPDRRGWTVFDAMHSGPVFTARPDEPLREAAARIVSHGVGCLPVVDDGDTLVGILTRSDLLSAAVSALREGG